MSKSSGGSRGEDKTHGYKWTQSKIDDLKQQGWKVNGELKDIAETYNNWDIKKTVETINDAANGIGLHVSKVRMSDYNINILLSDDKGFTRARITRGFGVDLKGKKYVENEYFDVDGQYQGMGFSKIVLREMVGGAKRSGYDRVEVHANINVGGYTWARYGFKANDYSQAMRACGGNEKLRSFVNSYYKNRSTNEPFPMQKLMESGISQTDLKSMIGTNWFGFIDLHDQKQMRYFKKYVGSRKG